MTNEIEQRKSINSKYANRILIHHELDSYGEAIFHIVHKKDYWTKPNSDDVPAKYKQRKTFKGAESAAIHLLINYEQYF